MQHVLWRRFGFHNLLFWLFVYLVVTPFLSTIPYSMYIFQMFLSLVLLFAIFAIRREKEILTLSVILLTLTLVFHWLGTFGVIRYSGRVSNLIMVLYLGPWSIRFSGAFSPPPK